jgi:hypothetical protein
MASPGPATSIMEFAAREECGAAELGDQAARQPEFVALGWGLEGKDGLSAMGPALGAICKQSVEDRARDIPRHLSRPGNLLLARPRNPFGKQWAVERAHRSRGTTMRAGGAMRLTRN